MCLNLNKFTWELAFKGILKKKNVHYERWISVGGDNTSLFMQDIDDGYI